MYPYGRTTRFDLICRFRLLFKKKNIVFNHSFQKKALENACYCVFQGLFTFIFFISGSSLTLLQTFQSIFACELFQPDSPKNDTAPFPSICDKNIAVFGNHRRVRKFSFYSLRIAWRLFQYLRLAPRRTVIV